MRRLLAAVPLLLTACALRPGDPFERAERELARSRLLHALEALDAVPISHARYPDVRAYAADAERRVQLCQELMLEAVQLRRARRDRDALERLRLALAQWPSAPGLARWISVTEQRIATFAVLAPGDGDVPEGAAAALEAPAAPVSDASMLPAPLAEPALPPPAPALPPQEPGAAAAAADESSRSEPAREPAPPTSPEPRARTEPPVLAESPGPSKPRPEVLVRPAPPPPVATGAVLDAATVRADLAAAERLLARGERHRAIAALDALARACPSAGEVVGRLASLLQQRALLHYGSGRLGAARSDWRRILELQPDNEAVRSLCERAVEESRRASRR